MNKEEFIGECEKEGLIIYGTTWESNFKRLKELKKYKEIWEGSIDSAAKVWQMWEELYVIHGNTIVDDIASLSNVMEILEQRYFPNSINKINQLLMELDVLIHETLGLLGG